MPVHIAAQAPKHLRDQCPDRPPTGPHLAAFYLALELSCCRFPPGSHFLVRWASQSHDDSRCASSWALTACATDKQFAILRIAP